MEIFENKAKHYIEEKVRSDSEDVDMETVLKRSFIDKQIT